MIIFSYFFLLFLTIILTYKTFFVLHTDYSYKRNHIVPHKDRFSFLSVFALFFYSRFLFSNASLFDPNEDSDYIILNFLYKNEKVLQDYLEEEYDYEVTYSFRSIYFDNFDIYFINKFIEENDLLTKYKEYYKVENKKDFLSKIKVIADNDYSSDIQVFIDRPELKEDFYSYLNNDGFISEFEFKILNEKLFNLKSNDEEVYNFCIYSQVLLDLKNQCYQEYKDNGFVTVKTENLVNSALHENDLYLEFIDHKIYLDDIREEVVELNNIELTKLLEEYTKDDFFSYSDYQNIQEAIKKEEREIFLNSESSQYQKMAANFVIEHNGKTKNDILKMKEEYGYLPYRSKDIIVEGLKELIEDFDENETIFIFEYHFKHKPSSLSTTNHIITNENCEMLIPLKDNIFSEFEFDKIFDVYYYNCRN